MPDLLDGPVIDGRYPSHSTPPGSTVDLEAVEGDDRPDLIALAATWYGHYIAARPNVMDHNTDPSVRERVMKALLADARRLIAIADTPPATSPPLSANDRAYLAWLAWFDAVPPSEFCPGLGPFKSAESRRRLTKLGYIAPCVYRGSHGYGITPAGRAAVAAGGVELADIDGE